LCVRLGGGRCGRCVRSWTANLTTTTKGKSTTQSYWTVREQIAGSPVHDGRQCRQRRHAERGHCHRQRANAGIYVAGQAQKVSGGQEDWVVRRAATAGAPGRPWMTSSTAQPAFRGRGRDRGPGGKSLRRRLGRQSHKRLDHTYDWLVRKSADGGATWTINDDYHVSSNYAEAYAAGVDLAGNEYVSARPRNPASGTPLFAPTRAGHGLQSMISSSRLEKRASGGRLPSIRPGICTTAVTLSTDQTPLTGLSAPHPAPPQRRPLRASLRKRRCSFRR